MANRAKAKGTASAESALSKTCSLCGQVFEKPSGYSIKMWESRRYCSQVCSRQARKQPWQERLWRRVDVGWDHSCWKFTGYCHPTRGYGSMGLGKEAHVLAYEYWFGPVPTGLVVRHACDNPPCCNPNHLAVGTHTDNMKDALERGRTARGFRLPHTKLSETEVADIRSRYIRNYEIASNGQWKSNAKGLADEFGIHVMYVHQLARHVYRAEI